MMRSPLHDFHARHGARFVDFGDWEMPVQYQSVLAEHRSVRSGAGVFDVSHLGRFALRGSGALGAIDRLLCNDIRKIGPGRTQYTLMLNEEGGIIDDLIVWWWDENDFWVLPNAANHDRVMGVFAAQAECETTDLRDSSVLLAVQGPEAPAAFEDVIGVAPARFRTSSAGYDGGVVSMAGTGYTGERGGEICTDPETASGLIESLVESGVALCGLGARDTLRLEAGLPLWGEDIDESTTPIEAGLDFAVGMGHDFIGRHGLEARHGSGVAGRRLIGFILEDRGIPRHGHTLRSGDSVGVVTSGNISPILQTGIGLGYLEPPADVGDPVEVEIRGRPVTGRIASPPFHVSP